MKCKPFNRALAALLSLMLIVGFLPTTVFAAENNPTSLIVGNVNVDTTQTGYWTTDDSGMLTASDESNYNVYYDANGTLYLNNATISGVSTTNYGAGIWFKGGDLVISLEGNNKINASSNNGYSAGIFNSYDFKYGLTLTGGGSLDISSSDANSSAYAIFIAKDITLDNVNVTASTGKANNTRNEVIRSEAGSIYIRNSTVYVESPDNDTVPYSRGLMAGNGLEGISITIENSTVTAIAGNARSDSTAIEANDVIIKNSFVIADGQYYSIGVYDGVDFTDSLIHLTVRQDNAAESSVFGNYTLSSDYTVGSDEIMNVEENGVLTVGEGTSLTNQGKVVNKGTIQVNIGGTYSGDQPETNKVKYEIGWDTDGNGTVNENSFYEYGASLIYNGQTPSKEGDAQYRYEFSGWSPAIADGATVSSAALYSATFTPVLNYYTVTLPQENGYSINYTGNTSIPYNGDFSFTVDFEEGYYSGENFAVKVNGTAIQSDDNGVFNITGITDDKQITIEGVEYDGEIPAINGIEDGKTYCEETNFTVLDDNLDSVTIDGTVVTPDANGYYLVTPATNAQTITAIDKAGNSLSYTITVNDGHTFTNYVSNNDATCTVDGTETAKCDYCNTTDTKTIVDSAIGHNWNETAYVWSEDGKSCTAIRTCRNDANHKEEATAVITSEQSKAATCTEKGETTYSAVFTEDWANGQIKTVADIPATDHTLKKVLAKEPTETAEGNIECWYCEICGKYFKDENGQTEISKEQIVIPVKETGTESTTSPQTGDDSNIALWMALMLAAGAALTGTAVYSRKRKYSR